MSIDVAKLTNVLRKDDKIVARCPACAAQDGDATGNNLVVFADGKFGCVAFPKDKGHNRMIFQLAGVPDTKPEIYRVPVRRVTHAPPKILKVVGRLGRSLATAPAAEVAKSASAQASELSDKDTPPAPTKTCPPRPPVPPVDTTTAAPPAVPKLERDVDKETEELLESLGYETLPDGTIIDPSRDYRRVAGWRVPSSM